MMDFSRKEARARRRRHQVIVWQKVRHCGADFVGLLALNRAPRKALQRGIMPLSIESNIGVGSVKYWQPDQ
jgi:hypothetical protein